MSMDTLQSKEPAITIAALRTSFTDSRDTHFGRYLRFRGTESGEPIALEAIGPDANADRKYKYAASVLAISQMPKCTSILLRESDESIQPRGCFVQQNALDASIVARQKTEEWVPLKSGDGIKATNITARRACYIDLDPPLCQGSCRLDRMGRVEASGTVGGEMART
jgi:hypothetical protein